VGGKAVSCNDQDPCTDDSCDPIDGCVHEFNSAQCDDGDACTAGDACCGGTCLGKDEVSCDDLNACTSDGCDEIKGCLHTAAAGPCDDGDPCTSQDKCLTGVCVGMGQTDCDDQNSCTADSCEPGSGCVHAPLTGKCEDGDPCTNGDQCKNGVCMAGMPVQCDDGEACTEDSCAPGLGCVFAPKSPCCGNETVESGEECDDGNPVAGDGCDEVCSLEETGLAFAGFAYWYQDAAAQTDEQQDAAMEAACDYKWPGSLPASTQEIVSGHVSGLPAANMSSAAAIGACPWCEGIQSGGPSGHCRKCVDPQAAWPKSLFSGFSLDCCVSTRSAICVL
jgi:cysteine-rich repeat protein